MADPSAPRIVEVRFSLPLSRRADVAWQRLVNDIDAWWPRDYRVLPGSRMRLDARPGGALLEAGEGDDGVLWYTVQAALTGHWLVLAGHIAPPWGGPALSLLRFDLRTSPSGEAEIEVLDSIMGRADAVAVEAGWRAIIGAYAA
jgi:hypothetical protein